MRKLATFSIALTAAVFSSHYLPLGESLFLIAAGFAVLSFAGLLFRGDTKLRIMLISLGLAAGFLVSGINYATRVAPCLELSGETATFDAEVREYPYVDETFAAVPIKILDENLPKVDAVAYLFGEEAKVQLKPGDRVTMTARLKYAGERYGESWDVSLADNVFLICYPEAEIEITGESPVSFMYFAQDIQRAVVNTALEIFPEESAAFMIALLTGNKQLLYEDIELYAAMSAAGILHIVAVSGMHVAFLVGFLRLILRKKRVYSLVGIIMVWVFAAMAGGTPSVIRAAFMISAVLIAPLIRRENDGITSLMAILAILLIINPSACASIGLQLSFSAMLGMILVTPRVYMGVTKAIPKKKKDKIGYKILYAVLASFAATIGAIAFSTPLIAIHFGTFSLYTIFVNILIFWTISVCFVLGYIACFLGMIWIPLGAIPLGYIVNTLMLYVIAVVEFIASLPYAQLFVGGGYFLFWLIFTYALFIGWIIWRRGKPLIPIIPTALVVTGLCVGIIITELPNPASFTAVDVGQGQSLILTADEGTVVIDCGGLNEFRNAGDTVAIELLSEGIRSVDVLCITHFDDDHVNGVLRLMSKVEVKNIVIPPVVEFDESREDILQLAEAQGTRIHIIEENTEIRVGGICLDVVAPLSEIQPELIYLANVYDCDILVTGDANEEFEARLTMTQDLPDFDIYVAGHHGSKYSSSQKLLDEISAEIAVISCGYNSYGHPTKETIERMKNADMEILRTDEMGTIRIILD